MNNNYMYPNYQGNSMRVMPNSRASQLQNPYSDSILSHYLGKKASFYLTFNDSNEWRDTIFKGTIQDTNSDYTIISDDTTNKPILMWNKFIDYIIFD